MITIASVKWISAKALSEKILAERDLGQTTYAVVDVRDDDYLGGHIKDGIHIPSAQLDVMMPTLVRRLADKKMVVFHCMFSQVRGPSSAVRYLREKAAVAEAGGSDASGPDAQVVYCLEGGFASWQQSFGPDERLTEGYRKELWEEE